MWKKQLTIDGVFDILSWQLEEVSTYKYIIYTKYIDIVVIVWYI